MGRSQVWTCDAPECPATSATDPIPLWPSLAGQKVWRFVLGQYICPAHRVALMVDGTTLVVDA